MPSVWRGVHGKDHRVVVLLQPLLWHRIEASKRRRKTTRAFRCSSKRYSKVKRAHNRPQGLCPLWYKQRNTLSFNPKGCRDKCKCRTTANESERRGAYETLSSSPKDYGQAEASEKTIQPRTQGLLYYWRNIQEVWYQ